MQNVILAVSEVRPADRDTKAFRFVLRCLCKDNYSELVVHTQNMCDESFHNGYYTRSLEKALDNLKDRAKKQNLLILELTNENTKDNY